MRQENLAFAGTAGVSREGREQGFTPAFHDSETGRTVIARWADGRPAPMHLLDGLPDAWVTSRDPYGHVLAVKASIVAGFVRDGIFYTREEAAIWK